MGVIAPGAIWMPGAASGYRKGRNNMQCCVHHYTVGVDSTGIGLDGYFTALLPKVGAPEQYCEVDALCWHAGEANPYGPGFELERLGDWEPPTPDQTYWGGVIDRWLRDEHGIADFYTSEHAGRIAPSSLYGFVNHCNVQQSNGHVDYWSEAEVAAMRGAAPGGPGAPIPNLEELPMPFVMKGPHAAAVVTEDEVYTITPDASTFTLPHVSVDQGIWDYIVADVRYKFNRKYPVPAGMQQQKAPTPPEDAV